MLDRDPGWDNNSDDKMEVLKLLENDSSSFKEGAFTKILIAVYIIANDWEILVLKL